MRSSLVTSFVLSLCLAAAGCGGQDTAAPQPGELENYLQENPDAAARGGQGEPAGFEGPNEISG